MQLYEQEATPAINIIVWHGRKIFSVPPACMKTSPLTENVNYTIKLTSKTFTANMKMESIIITAITDQVFQRVTNPG